MSVLLLTAQDPVRKKHHYVIYGMNSVNDRLKLKIISTFANKQLLFIAAACDASVLVEVVAESDASVLVEVVVECEVTGLVEVVAECDAS
ncbi:hypothetical protein BpHYR1_006602, partial [Brachionus plicatilis]